MLIKLIMPTHSTSRIQLFSGSGSLHSLQAPSEKFHPAKCTWCLTGTMTARKLQRTQRSGHGHALWIFQRNLGLAFNRHACLSPLVCFPGVKAPLLGGPGSTLPNTLACLYQDHHFAHISQHPLQGQMFQSHFPGQLQWSHLCWDHCQWLPRAWSYDSKVVIDTGETTRNSC